MEVEYETTPTTGNPGAMLFSAGKNAAKKRVTSQENFRTGLFFGKRKRERSHRERHHDYDHHRLHSSSLPRQREFCLGTPKNSYLEYKSRKYSKTCERMLPLNKNIISKIEKISLGVTPTDKPLLKSAFAPLSTESSFQVKSLSIDGPSNAIYPQQSGSFDSTSSLSSSESEAGLTNDGDDELTDWPGNHELINFASKNDFKRAKPYRSNAIGNLNNKASSFLHGKGGNNDEDVMAQDEDTLMSADEPIMPMKLSASNDILAASSSCTSDNNLLLQDDQSGDLRSSVSLPINIVSQPVCFQPRSQIESEMSGETSNYFLSSPTTVPVREIRAGCRRIRNESRGFLIFTSVNEHISRCVCRIFPIKIMKFSDFDVFFFLPQIFTRLTSKSAHLKADK